MAILDRGLSSLLLIYLEKYQNPSFKTSKRKIDQFSDKILPKMQKSIFEKVHEFTSQTYGAKDSPVPISKDKIKFIIRMIISESLELANTITADPKTFVQECLDTTDLPRNKTEDEINELQINPVDLIDEQMDAFIDIEYYLNDTAARHGINMTEAFDEVHQANMNKKWDDGKFHIRESDGKIDKPPNFRPPSTKHLVRKMMQQGSWPNKDNNN